MHPIFIKCHEPHAVCSFGHSLLSRRAVTQKSLINTVLDTQNSQICLHVNVIKSFNFHQQVKKGKMNVDSVLKNIDTLMPDELRDDTKRAVNVCKDHGGGIKDYCQAAYNILKCFFKENPNFYFP